MPLFPDILEETEVIAECDLYQDTFQLMTSIMATFKHIYISVSVLN